MTGPTRQSALPPTQPTGLKTGLTKRQTGTRMRATGLSFIEHVTEKKLVIMD